MLFETVGRFYRPRHPSPRPHPMGRGWPRDQSQGQPSDELPGHRGPRHEGRPDPCRGQSEALSETPAPVRRATRPGRRADRGRAGCAATQRSPSGSPTPSRAWPAISAPSLCKPPPGRWRNSFATGPPQRNWNPSQQQVAAALDPLLAQLRGALELARHRDPGAGNGDHDADPAQTRAAATQLTKLLSEFDSSAVEFIEANHAGAAPAVRRQHVAGLREAGAGLRLRRRAGAVGAGDSNSFHLHEDFNRSKPS